ncbi:unnamed protein product, partial [Medioppia subpectinata]
MSERNNKISFPTSTQKDLSMASICAPTATTTVTKTIPNNGLLCPPDIKPRKYSLPLINPNQISPNDYLESCQLRKSFPSTILDSLDLPSQKRRLSQVGIAVSNRLSTTIGVKLLLSHNHIVKESKCLCSRFIRLKLRKRGLVHKRLNLHRLKSLCNIRVDSRTSLVANELKYLVNELERSYPKLFSSVLNNITTNSFKSVNEIQSILQLISQELFRNDITWARIAALYAITGALAVDSVQVGHPEYIMPIIDTFTAFIDRDIAGWIAQQGGW